MTAIDWLDNELQKEMTIENAPGRSYVMIPLDTYMNRKAQAKKMEILVRCRINLRIEVIVT